MSLQDAEEINSRMFCLQAKDLITFLHDVAAAVPVSAVVPPAVWDALQIVMQTGSFGSAGNRSFFRVIAVTFACAVPLHVQRHYQGSCCCSLVQRLCSYTGSTVAP